MQAKRGDKFDSRLLLEEVDDYQWDMRRVLRFRAKDGRVFEVEVGFITDLASVPTVYRW